MALILLSIIFALTSNIIIFEPKDEGFKHITPQKAKEYIYKLSDDARLGREAGSKSNREVAKFLSREFKSIGLEPYGRRYLMPFRSNGWMDSTKNVLRMKLDYDTIPDSTLQEYKIKKYKLNNVLGMIEGHKSDEFIIIGAHYDHLGVDYKLEGDNIYNGADDNASGVAAILQIAKAFKESGIKPHYSVIFALWDGEEKGLLGSRYYVENECKTENIKGYINFDMIGRSKSADDPRFLILFYTAAYPQFEEWVKEDINTYSLNLSTRYHAWDKPEGGSDNTHFAKNGIPIIWYSTGGHSDYHKPSDEAHKIDWDLTSQITISAYLTLLRLANPPIK